VIACVPRRGSAQDAVSLASHAPALWLPRRSIMLIASRHAVPLVALGSYPHGVTQSRGVPAMALLPGNLLTRRAAIAAVTFSQQRPQSAWAWAFGKRWPTDAPDEDNIFLRILKGDAPADVVDGNDPDLFTFRDRRPASDLHLLVIPRQFVRDASSLRSSDAALVRSMEVKARALVRAQYGDAFEESELALGFHWPPWYSVPWLHLHAIYPRSRITRWYKYTPISFKSPSWVLRRLEREKAP
jgi:diadenosine tetraphosphate (Ap4A) HIT family hydrolase